MGKNFVQRAFAHKWGDDMGPPDPESPAHGRAPPGWVSVLDSGPGPHRKTTRFEAPEQQPHQPTAPIQRRFPFTVFAKVHQNQPDLTSRRQSKFDSSGHGEHIGKCVGNHIMKKYVVLEPLKKGGMAEAVNVVQQQHTGTFFVQKCIPLHEHRDHKRARAEINTLSRIAAHGANEHLNAIIEAEISEARGQCSIILEYCDLGTVEESITCLRKRGVHGSEASAWNLIAGVANGLAFLHHGVVNGRRVAPKWDPICHLDLKPCNIFISSEGGKHGHNRVVLADFGCAITLSDVVRHIESPFVPECGTPAWYPPEGLADGSGKRASYGPKTDIWQLGATVHVLCKLLGHGGPARPYLTLPRPCSGLYSNRLNRVVKQLCHPVSDFRPIAPEVAREAADGFDQAARSESVRKCRRN